MTEFSVTYSLDGGSFTVTAIRSEQWIDLEIEIPSGERIPARYYLATGKLESRFVRGDINAGLIAGDIRMVQSIPEQLDENVQEVALRAIHEFNGEMGEMEQKL